MFNAGLVVLSLIAAGMLYNMKYEVQSYRLAVRKLERQLASEREAIQVLQAEWSYLNRPERLQRLAEQYTSLRPVRMEQIVSLDDLPGRAMGPIPDLSPAMGGYAGLGAGGSRIQ
ncbi:MAG: hypothetical protein C0605_01950 [Hyphomicrobiales bacterium]|nr:MAG: hypothetical protein C0605_01950 [Hyphomicrobiales bacterium]